MLEKEFSEQGGVRPCSLEVVVYARELEKGFCLRVLLLRGAPGCNVALMPLYNSFPRNEPLIATVATVSCTLSYVQETGWASCDGFPALALIIVKTK